MHTEDFDAPLESTASDEDGRRPFSFTVTVKAILNPTQFALRGQQTGDQIEVNLLLVTP